MERLRELRGADTRERDLANILGFEHSRAVRWKEGQMYVDRAEYLVRLADALEVDTMLLVQLASGSLTVEQAQRQLQRVGRGAVEDTKKRKSGAAGGVASAVVSVVPSGKVDPVDLAADAGQFATDASLPAKVRADIVPDRPLYLVEFVIFREALRWQAACLSPISNPLFQVCRGDGPCAAGCVTPRKAIGQNKSFDVRKCAVFVFLQAHTLASRHFRHL